MQKILDESKFTGFDTPFKSNRFENVLKNNGAEIFPMTLDITNSGS